MITSHKKNAVTNRIHYLDSLRGLAVILMVQQHLQSWLWNVNWLSYPVTLPEHPFMLSIHFTGWLAAPLFVILAGTGAAIMKEKRSPVSEYIQRGLMILACGYLLNFIIPNWFVPGSWYVLHTIGLAVLLSPLIMRIKNQQLVILTLIIIFIPALLQTCLKTPLMTGNLDMNNITLSGGLARIIFVEGHFPVFPWISFFMTGILSRRMINQNTSSKILYTSIIVTVSSIFLGSLYNHGYFFATGGKFFRVFVPLPYFYPPLPPFIFFIMGISLLLFYIFYKCNLLLSSSIFSPLNALGRSSLSWFILHIFIFNQTIWLIGWYKSFKAVEVILITLISLLLMVYISFRWQKYDFKYGIEWIIRRYTSSKI